MAYIGKAPPITTNLLEDADQDTKIQVEESADEDIIRFDIAGAEDFTMAANTFTVLSGSTLAIASGATIANSGTATGFSASTLDAATTVGDGTAEDTKIVFDGNAQDYYIGLDDTDDDLKIGLGSTVGTTAHIVIDEAGTVTKPLQPAFHVEVTSQSDNVTGGGTAISPVGFGTERWDVNSDFSSNTFTAPVTGKYLLYTQIALGGVTTSMTFGHIQIVTSNRTHKRAFHPSNLEALVGGNITNLTLNVVTDMDVSDTATVVLTIANGSDVADLYPNIGDTYSYFGGILLA